MSKLHKLLIKSTNKTVNCVQLLRHFASTATTSTTTTNYSLPPLPRSNSVPERHFDEIRITVPWGHISGKWYGPKHVRPIVALHGWQDNAGTFDTLVPLMPPHIPVLALDLPGHGRSSWLPDGLQYYNNEYLLVMHLLLDEYKWDKLSLLAHSMSSINSFVFTALFPDKVDLNIGLDVLKPLVRSPASVVDIFSKRIEQQVKLKRRLRDKTEQPTYTWEQMIERLYLGSNKSVDMDKCQYLLQRNVKPSATELNKYYFSRDVRLRAAIPTFFSQEVLLEMARRIQVPHLFIKASGAPYYEDKKYFDETIEILQKNPNFEHYMVEGTHHVHLNEPEKVSQLVNNFILKWRT